MPVTTQDHESSEFRYTFKSGKTLVLPKLTSLMTFGTVRKLRKLSDQEAIFTLLEDKCSEEELAVLDEMDMAESDAFFSAWQADSGANLPESPGSSS